MNEIGLFRSERRPIYGMPEVLGPGPSELIGGDPNAGFFGEVLSSDIINGLDLANRIGLVSGTAQNSDIPWLKFVLDGKLLFIPKKTLRTLISWNQINAVDAVYGDREIVINNYLFKIRLIKTINPKITVIDSALVNGADKAITHDSEWNRLMYPICEEIGNYHKTSQKGPNWANYSVTELNVGGGNSLSSLSWCQERDSIDNTKSLLRGSTSDSGVTGSSWGYAWENTNKNYGWRPLLELVGHAFNGITGLHYTTEYVGSPRLDDWNYTD